MLGFGKSKKLEQELAALREEMGQIKNAGQSFASMSSSDWSEFFGAVKASSGAVVTNESAKRSAAVYACARLIAGAVALLPLPIYERKADGSRQSIDHNLWWLLNESPYPTLTACSFWEWMLSSALMRGDGLAQIVRNANGQPINFMPLPRECVQIEKRGESLVYFVDDGERKFGLDAADVLHFPGYGFNGICGESVIKYAARQAVGTALAADDYAGEFFANGASPSITINYPEGVAPTPDQQEHLRSQFTEKYTGKGNRHRPLLLVNGGKAEAVSLTAEDAQLLETRKFQVIEIARAFGVPPHMVGETSASTSWGSGIEQMSIGFVRYTLGPHLRRIEQELNRKLWPRSMRYFVEFNRDGLLAGDSKTESEVIGKSLGGPGAQGWMTVNEARKLKNLPPVPGGDELPLSVAETRQQSETTQDAAVSAANRSHDILAGLTGAVVAMGSRETPAAQIRVDAPIVNVQMPDIRADAPVINIENKMPDQPAPSVTVENIVPQAAAPDVHVEFEAIMPAQAAPNVNIVNEVQPAEVSVNLPTRRTDTEITRDQHGNISRATQIERDL